jgi:hypothetical protein
MKELLPIFTLIAGAALALLSTLVASSIQHRRTFAVKLLEQYLVVRQDVAEKVAPLTHIDVNLQLAPETRQQLRDSISLLYYRHFDFLPEPVLNSLVRLQTCIDRPDIGPISIKNNMISAMPMEEIPEFVEECSLLRNAVLFAPVALTSNNPVVRHNYAVRLHARHVLFQMNKFASINSLLNLERTMKKNRAI